MPALHDDVYDNGLSQISTLTEKLYILKADPGLLWNNITTHALGSKTSPIISDPGDRAEGGRKVTVSEITDGLVTGTGTQTAEYYALTDDSAGKILVSGSLASGQPVTDGNPFTLSEFDIGIPDPV